MGYSGARTVLEKKLEEGCTFKSDHFLPSRTVQLPTSKKAGRIHLKLWPSSNIATLIAT